MHLVLQLTLGDEITASDDVQLIFPDSSTLTIAAGQLNYKNLSPNAIQLWNNNQITFAPGTTLQLYENMNIQTGHIMFGSNAGAATYLHRQSPCPITSDIIGIWGGNWIEAFFC